MFSFEGKRFQGGQEVISERTCTGDSQNCNARKQDTFFVKM